jgi:hypothetical protein
MIFEKKYQILPRGSGFYITNDILGKPPSFVVRGRKALILPSAGFPKHGL